MIDQLTKAWVSQTLNYGEPWVFTSFFNFTLLHNYGAAFSFLSDAGGWQKWFFLGNCDRCQCINCCVDGENRYGKEK